MALAPQLSVCIPVRDGERYVHAAVESALAHDLDGLEVVVCDDASTDGTAAVLAAIRDPRLRVVRTGRSSGVGVARNACVAAARGTYIAWLDADDEYLPGALARQAEVLDRHPNVGLTHGAFEVVDEDGRPLPAWPAPFETDTVLPSGAAFAELLLSNHVVTASTVMARSRLLERAGPFEEELDVGEDWDMWLRLSLLADVAYLASPVVRYRRHGASLTARARRGPPRLSADATVVRRALAGSDSLGLDPSIRRRAGAALGAKAILAAGEALTRGSRGEAVHSAWLSYRLAGDLLPVGEALGLARELALGREYGVYLRSRSLLRRLQEALAGTILGRSLEALVRPDPEWEGELRAVARTVNEVLPRRARVLAVDKWDPTLLHLTGRRGSHFPDRRLLPDGYPRDSAEAIEHLELLRAQPGADYLVFPSAAFWWLEFYAGLRGHLEHRYQRIWDDERCVIYGLDAAGASA